jgi:hypothetical protein
MTISDATAAVLEVSWGTVSLPRSAKPLQGEAGVNRKARLSRSVLRRQRDEAERGWFSGAVLHIRTSGIGLLHSLGRRINDSGAWA